MSSIFKKPDLTPRKGRNGFDLSFRRMFTAPCGMLLPVATDFSNPGDKYKLNSSLFVRTEAVQTAAMMRLKAHVDWFFVPITQLYSLWNEFFNSTNDVMSSIYDTALADLTKLPSASVFPYMWNFVDNAVLGSKTTVSGGKQNFKLTVDEFGVPYLFNFRRLWDMLGYGSLDSYKYAFADNMSFNLFPFLAYHKIYHSHYNLTNWFPNNPKLYNADQWYSDKSMNPVNFVNILSTMHYRRYRTDFWTNVLPQPVFSSSYANFISSFAFNSDTRYSVNPEGISLSTVDRRLYSNLGISGVNSDVPSISGDLAQSQSVYLGSSFRVTESPQVPISVTDIRAMFALDKLLRVTAFAGSHYDEQVKAHFGYEMPKGLGDEAYFLGNQTTDISINEVVATSSTATKEGSSTTVEGAGTVIGDIAGKGFGASNGSKDINFEAPCHGYIMAIFSIEPIPDYASRGCEVQNRYSNSFDFYHPEFDNVGMQPLFGQFTYVDNTPNSEQLSGWQYRYSEWKTKFDIVNEGFWNTSKDSWVGSKQSVFDFSQKPVLNRNFMFYVCPQYTNSIFMNPFPFYSNANPYLVPLTQAIEGNNDSFTSDWSNKAMSAGVVYAGDNFLVSSDFKIYKSSIMSVHSLPKML